VIVDTVYLAQVLRKTDKLTILPIRTNSK